MRIQAVSQNNYQKQQNFSALTIAGSKISVEHLFKEGSGSSEKVRRLIQAAGCQDKDIIAAIFKSIRGLALMDVHSPAVTDIKLGPKRDTLLMSMSSSAWDEGAKVVALDLESIINGAALREKKLTPEYREQMASRIDALTTVLPSRSPEEISAEKSKIKEILEIEQPISQEVGFRFSEAYQALRRTLGLER